MSLTQYDWNSCKKRKTLFEHSHTQGKYHVTMETETEMLQLKAKECQRLLENH